MTDKQKAGSDRDTEEVGDYISLLDTIFADLWNSLNTLLATSQATDTESHVSTILKTARDEIENKIIRVLYGKINSLKQTLDQSRNKIKEIALFHEDNPNFVFRIWPDNKLLIINNAFKNYFWTECHNNIDIRDLLINFDLNIESIIKNGLSESIVIPVARWGNKRFYKFMLIWKKDFSFANVYAQDVTDIEIAKNQAEEAVRLKDDLFRNLEHELRTPMNALLWFPDFMIDDLKEMIWWDFDLDWLKAKLPGINTMAITLLKAAEWLNFILEDILYYARILDWKVQREFSPFILNKEVGAALERLRVWCENKGLDLSINIDENIPARLIWDSKILSKILEALFDNAIKFTSKWNINLDVKLECKDEEKVDIIFIIKDSWIGIPNEKKRLLFDIMQWDWSIARHYWWLWMWLAIVWKLINILGKSELSVDSIPNKGTEIKFTCSFWHC